MQYLIIVHVCQRIYVAFIIVDISSCVFVNIAAFLVLYKGGFLDDLTISVYLHKIKCCGGTHQNVLANEILMSIHIILFGPCPEKTCLSGFPIRSDTNRAVQPQEMATRLRI